jgi:hypothetical protein
MFLFIGQAATCRATSIPSANGHRGAIDGRVGELRAKLPDEGTSSEEGGAVDPHYGGRHSSCVCSGAQPWKPPPRQLELDTQFTCEKEEALTLQHGARGLYKHKLRCVRVGICVRVLNTNQEF